MPRPDFTAMSLPELRAWEAALRLATAALEHAGATVFKFARAVGFGSWR